MSSNEEYLDNLLKSMEEKEEKNGFENPPDIAEEGNSKPDFLKETVSEGEGEEESGQSFDDIKNLSEEDIMSLLGTSEDEKEDAAEDSLLPAEDEIDLSDLLQNADESDEDLSDIKDLLYKDEHDETVEETSETLNENPVSSEDSTSEKKKKPGLFRGISDRLGKTFHKSGKEEPEDSGEESENPVSVEESPDENSVISDDSQQSDEELGELSEILQSIENGETGENAESKDDAEDTGNKSDKESTDKKEGFFKRFINFLLEEDEDGEEPVDGDGSDVQSGEEEFASVTSEENREILEQLSKEDQKGRKKKKKKKGKDFSDREENEDADENEDEDEKSLDKKKKKKEKKSKKEKRVKEAEIPESPVKLPKKKIKLTVFFALTLATAILLCCLLVPGLFEKTEARKCFYDKEYQDCFTTLYGKKLSESDQRMFEQSVLHLLVQRKMKIYDSYVAVGEEIRGLDVLFQTVKDKENVLKKAEEYNYRETMEKEYQVLLDFIYEKYGLNEEEIMNINDYEEDAVYTLRLKSIVEHTEFEMPAFLSPGAEHEGEK